MLPFSLLQAFSRNHPLGHDDVLVGDIYYKLTIAPALLAEPNGSMEAN